MIKNYIFVLLLTGLSASDSLAATIFSKSLDVTAGGWGSAADAPTFFRQQVADEFVLGNTESISEIGWIGFGGSNGSVSTTGFVLRVFEDDAGLPDTSQILLDLSLSSVTGIDIGIPTTTNPTTRYAYSTILANPLVLNPGKYWLSIFETDTLTFSWSKINNPSDTFAVKNGPSGGDWRLVTNASDNDLVFSLGAPLSEDWYVTEPPVQSVVPVPAAVWLFGSGLLGLVGVARHKES